MESYTENLLKKSSTALILIALLYLFPSPAAAYQFQSEAPAKTYSFDHVINRRGESRISMLTGIPIVGTAEYAYGISDRLTAGVFGGFTPFEEAVGIRVRTVLYQKKRSFRVYYCTPIVFYPQSSMAEPEPWWLIRPNINFEWLVNSGFRYKFGASLIGVATHRQVFGGDGSEDQQLSPELWTAIHGGFSLPVGKQFSFQTELSYITKGTETITDFFGGPPMLAIIGLSYTF